MSEVAVPRISLGYRLAAGTAFTVMRLQRWEFDVEGIEHVPQRGGAVIAANHTSYWDFFAAGRGPYRAWGRPVRILAKASLFDTPVFGRVLRHTGHIPVHRSAGTRAYTSAVAALRRGELVLVLPEQTISPSFELLPLKSGVVRMAAAADVPVVPAVTWGTHRFHTVGRRPRWTWRLPVSVAYGRPLVPSLAADAGTAMAELRERLLGLLERVQRRYPDGAPPGAWWVPQRLGGSAPSPAEVAEHLAALERRWRDTVAVARDRARRGVSRRRRGRRRR